MQRVEKLLLDKKMCVNVNVKKMKQKQLLRNILWIGMVLVIIFQMGILWKNITSDVILPNFSREVLLTSKADKRAYNYKLDLSKAVEEGNPYKAFSFKYDLKGKSGILYLSEREDFVVKKEVELPQDVEEVLIDNLKTATKYYYQVVVGEHTYEGTFVTAASTRYIKIPGVYNARDVGGYTNNDGLSVKQGMIIRGTEYDGLVERGFYLEEAYIEVVQKEFGFVYDFDLRSPDILENDYQVRLGENVQHKFYDSPCYEEIFDEKNLPKLKQIFSDLANSENYPMYMHCTYGADRTGTIVYLLQGVLNLSEQDMEREYKLTGYLFRRYAESTEFEEINVGLQDYKGNTISEKIVTYLVDEVGVTEEEIEAIRSILLEEYKR